MRQRILIILTLTFCLSVCACAFKNKTPAQQAEVAGVLLSNSYLSLRTQATQLSGLADADYYKLNAYLNKTRDMLVIYNDTVTLWLRGTTPTVNLDDMAVSITSLISDTTKLITSLTKE